MYGVWYPAGQPYPTPQPWKFWQYTSSGSAGGISPLDLDVVLFDARPEFRWHPGMLVDGATLQVPFLADLVSLADPTSRYSFLNYLRERGLLG